MISCTEDVPVKKIVVSVMTAITVCAASPALAYVGPGAGISLLGALWGLIVGVVAAIGIILFWPIRIMLRKRKAAREAAEAGNPTPGDAHEAQAQTEAPDKETQAS